ncbi:hypothetical protein C4580_01530 [Candidatus Woesearchaeota archaeon]|nr:MAG: hypothetical protein C4580_01530 [Candidatus Woesearchaeota archaeon]
MPPATPPPAPGPGPAPAAPAAGGTSPSPSGITLGKVVGILAGATVALGMMSAASPQGPLYRGPASESAREAYRHNDGAYRVREENGTYVLEVTLGNRTRTFEISERNYNRLEGNLFEYQGRTGITLTEGDLAHAISLLDTDHNRTISDRELDPIRNVLYEVTHRRQD